MSWTTPTTRTPIDLAPIKASERMMRDALAACGVRRWVGTGNRQCLCPFHDDHHPSAGIYLSRDGSSWLFKCGACGAGGDIIRVVALSRNMTDAAVLKHLAETGELLGVVQVEHRPAATKQQPPRRELDIKAIIHRWGAATTVQQVEAHARQLGVAMEPLVLLSAVWSAKYDAWAWPMSDAAGNWIGVRFRNVKADKWALTGGAGGLFLPAVTLDGPVFLVEGPTDTAAVLSMDLAAIGRPSCNSGDDLVVEWFKAHPGREAVILANRDTERQAGDRTVYPGQDGAAALADRLLSVTRSVKVILPTEGKDARQWLAAGATRDLLLTVAHDTARWRRRRSA